MLVLIWMSAGLSFEEQSSYEWYSVAVDGAGTMVKKKGGRSPASSYLNVRVVAK